MSGKYNIVLLQGATFNLNGTLNLGSTGAARNLTGYTIASQFRTEYNSETSNAFTSSIVTPVDGTWRVELSATDSSAVSASNYVYDIEIASGSYVERILEGTLLITPEATK